MPSKLDQLYAQIEAPHLAPPSLAPSPLRSVGQVQPVDAFLRFNNHQQAQNLLASSPNLQWLLQPVQMGLREDTGGRR